MLFLFKKRGRWGTIARSRDAGLHGRKPVFRTIRHLVMSYVDPYVDGVARIVGYGVADLRTLVKCDWRLSSKYVKEVERALIVMPHKSIKTSERSRPSAKNIPPRPRRSIPTATFGCEERCGADLEVSTCRPPVGAHRALLHASVAHTVLQVRGFSS